MNSIAGEWGARMVGEGLREENLRDGLVDVWGDRRSGDGGGRRLDVTREGDGGSGGWVDIRGEGFGEGMGESSYIGGGTKEAFLAMDVPPASRAACRSEAYLSWKDLLWPISIATARKSAAMPWTEDGVGLDTASSPHMMRARSCWCSGRRDWMEGTVLAHTRRKEVKAGGQLSAVSSIGGDDLLLRGSGTEGGLVVQRRAAKYRHNAGPNELIQ
jgi:hypothetical protein